MASKTLIRVSGVALAAAALILILTNPSLTDFTTWANAESGFLSRMTCAPHQSGNYVLFSRFEYRCMTSTTKYVGVLGNFYALDKPVAQDSK